MKQISYYVVKFYYKDEPTKILDGYVWIAGQKLTPYGENNIYLPPILKPEFMAYYMDKNNEWNFVVVSGTPMYQNEPEASETTSKGIIYDSLHVGLFLSHNFFNKIYIGSLLNYDEVNNILVGAGIFFLQHHQNKKRNTKEKPLNRGILYLRTMRYLKEIKNINL
jgi:hypothetical protein